MPAVSTIHDGPISRITLTRGDKLNAFNEDLVDGLACGLAEAEHRGSRLVIFRGEGKGFSGGFDLSGIDAASDGDLLLRFVRVEQLLQSVYHARCATLALVHGPCYGAAADLVAACHWRVGAPDARFRMPGSRFGIVLGTRRLCTLVGENAARQLLLRDKPFGRDEALATGFLTGSADQDGWPEIEDQITAQVMALSGDTFSALSDRKRTDTRAEDLAALVQSAAKGSVKQRVLGYLEQATVRRKTD